MRKVLTAVWDFLVEMGEQRAARLKENKHAMWY